MVKLDCSGVRFGCYLDEKYMYEWGAEITGFVRWDGNTLVFKSHRLSEKSLRNLLALFWRYRIPMRQLAQFENANNKIWFRSSKAYWHKKVFG